MQNAATQILLIGAGKMGGALLASWQRTRTFKNIAVLDPKASEANGATLFHSIEEVTVKPDCIVLAVKPQSLDALLPELAKKFGAVPPPVGGRLGGGQVRQNAAASPHPNPPPTGEGVPGSPLYISIAAGKTLGYFALALGSKAAVVRAMPNTPALIGEGISGLCANTNVNEAQKEFAGALLKAAGEVVWLKDEEQMDAVTAISGSGPAYVFLFLEALVNAGRQQGLPEAIAKQLAIQTLAGSAKLAKISQEPLANLRQNVTSPGGTTEAALKVMIKNNQFKNLMAEAVSAAVKRAKELA